MHVAVPFRHLEPARQPSDASLDRCLGFPRARTKTVAGAPPGPLVNRTLLPDCQRNFLMSRHCVRYIVQCISDRNAHVMSGYTLEQLLEWSIRDRLIDGYTNTPDGVEVRCDGEAHAFSSEQARTFLTGLFWPRYFPLGEDDPESTPTTTSDVPQRRPRRTEA